MDKKRLLIFHPTVAPYRIDFFNRLNECFETRVCLFHKDLMSNKINYSLIESQFNYTPFFLKEIIKIKKWVLYGDVLKHIKSFKPDIVIVNEFGLTTILVTIFKYLSGSHFKIISICDDNYIMAKDHEYSFTMHKIGRKVLAPYIDEIILPEPKVIELYQKQYHKGFFFPIIKDEKKARDVYKRLIPQSLQTIEKYKLSNKYVFLYVGRLVTIKNVSSIIRAFSNLNGECVLVIIGDGEEKQSLELLAKSTKNRIIFTGLLEDDNLYLWYNIADCFVLASVHEPFGAVTNEALLAGCWSLISKRAGSSFLIKDGINGYTFDPYSINDLEEKMKRSMEQNPHHALIIDKLRCDNMTESYQYLMNCLIHHLQNEI